ncbi:MAG: PepSY domain-containing protein, partial [Emcibacteraceae bacterium]|nr:PepSY domain-containing protein [Emcibacteraceae bacterium]
MTFHKILYWPHLICGVLAGILIFTMSVTGVLLTYERQIIAWAETDYEKPVAANANILPVDKIIIMNRSAMGERDLRSVKVFNNPEAPIVIRGGDYFYINRYSGEILGNGPKGVKNFFSDMRSLHRWLLMEDESRAVARMFIGAANLMFLFIVLSGIYLWIPKIFKWQSIKQVLFFRKTKSSRARDFNWHNVMGIWSAIPLVVVVATASVFYYGWANNLVYTLSGEDAPVRGRSSANDEPLPTFDQRVPFEIALRQAILQRDNWTSITMSYPKDTDENIRFSIDTGNGGEPHKKGDLYISRANGEIAKWEPFQDYSAGRQARNY